MKHAKGARVRWLSPIMVELCKLYKAGKAPKHRLEAVTALNNMYNALKVPWQKWLEEASKTFNSNTEIFWLIIAGWPRMPCRKASTCTV